MAAFFLTKGKNQELMEKAQAVFDARGFIGGRRYSLTCGELLIYQKQMVQADNCCIINKTALYAIGTPIYRGLSYADTLSALMEDMANGTLDKNALRGSFILLFDNGHNTTVMTDETGMYKLFTDGDGSFLSSSFLAAAACTPCTINEIALAEQVLCGFISAPDTLVNEVVDVRHADARARLSFVQWEGYAKAEAMSRSASIESSVRKQAEHIRRYMSDVQALVDEFGSECGLSGGCDSRLVYAATVASCRPLRSVHTHKTSNIHAKEIQTVEKLVSLHDTPLRIIPTNYILDCPPEEIDAVLKENVLYFDGRNAATIGAFSKTHTRDYRRATAAGSGVTFSGIAGEIYRNFYFTNLPLLSPRCWLESRIFIPHGDKIIPHKLYRATVERILEKLHKSTGVRVHPFATKQIAKRFFDGYRIPNALSNVVHANNQMGFYLAPFTEADLIRSAKPDFKYEDQCGYYEGKIIAEFSPEAAAMMSTKGYAFSSIPLKTRLMWRIKGYLPSLVWKERNLLGTRNSSFAERLSIVLESTKFFNSALNYFREEYPDWKIECLLNGDVFPNSFMFTVCTLYELSLIRENEIIH